MYSRTAPNQKPLKDHLQTLGVNINKKVLKLNINPKLFEMIGIFLVKIKIVKFTKWHFGSFRMIFTLMKSEARKFGI